MVTAFSAGNMLPLNLWNKQTLRSGPGADAAAGSGSLLAPMPFGHPLATSPGFIPVSFNSSLFRSGEHVPHGLYSYPALHPSFFRPHLDPAALGGLLYPRGMMALPHGIDARADPHPSAFTPAKRLRAQPEDCQSPRDDGSPHSPRDDGGSRDPDRDTSGSSNRTSPLTPLNSSSYSPASSLNLHRTNRELTEPHYVNGAEDLRLKWRCEDGESIRCPICKALLQSGEVRTHLYKEFTSLKEELQSASQKNSRPTRLAPDVNDSSSKSRYDTFLRIRRNREARLGKLRGERNKRKRYSDEMSQNSANEADDTVKMEHVLSRPLSPHRDTTEEETVDVTSCEDHDVGDIYSHPSATATTTTTTAATAATALSLTTADRPLSEPKETFEGQCISRQSPYTDPLRLT